MNAPAPRPLAASERRPRNWLALVLSVVTGLGHFYLGHFILGALLFTVFVSALNGVLMASILRTLERPEVLLWTSVVILATSWVGGLAHAWRLTYGTDREKLQKEKAALLKAGLLDYLRDDLDDAIKKLERAVRLDVDWVDPDPLFHLGVASLRLSERCARREDQGAARRARKRGLWALKKCQTRDMAGKWRREIESELKRLKRRMTGSGRMRALPVDPAESTEMLPPITSFAMAPAGESGSGIRVGLAGPVPVIEAVRQDQPSASPTAPLPESPAAKSSGSFPAVKSSGSFPSVRSSGRFQAISSSNSHSAIDPDKPADASGASERSGGQDRPTPARAPGRTSRRLLAKRLKKLLAEELGQEELGGDVPGAANPSPEGGT